VQRSTTSNWRSDHPWAAVYDFFVERETLSRAAGWLVLGTDTRLLYDAFEEITAVPDGAAILDIPCGGGVALRGLQDSQDVRYVAADVSEAMLRRAAAVASERGLPQVELEVADVEALPFADGEFDLILSFAGLHVFPRPAAAVEEIARCMAPGGRFVGSLFLADAGLRYLPLIVAARAAGLMGPSASASDLRRWMVAAGLADVTVRRSGAVAYFEAIRPA
jgi:ubiquinone/menaquinone biosynthesis C-methylase UbiE